MLELQTALYRDLVGPGCDECAEGPAACDRPRGLNSDGYEVERSDGDDLVVSWPGCPWKWAALRRWGADLLLLSSILAWAVERGVHRRRRLGAPAAQLLRHYVAARETPSVLRSRRERSDAELRRKALEAGRAGR